MTREEQAEIAKYRRILADTDARMERLAVAVQEVPGFALLYFPVWCIAKPTVALLRWLVNDLERMRNLP